MLRIGLRRRCAVMQEVEVAVNRSAGQLKLAEEMLQGSLQTKFAGPIMAALLPLLIQFGLQMLQKWLSGELNTPQLRTYGIEESEDSRLDDDDTAELAAFNQPPSDTDTVELQP